MKGLGRCLLFGRYSAMSIEMITEMVPLMTMSQANESRQCKKPVLLWPLTIFFYLYGVCYCVQDKTQTKIQLQVQFSNIFL